MRFIKFFTIVLLIKFGCLISPSFSQQLEVKNVSFESNGKIVQIKYDLLGNYDKKHKVSLYLSNDNGKTFSILPKFIQGDIGKNIKPGKNKQITWHMYKDFPSGLTGDEYVFAVDAELQKGRKWPFYVIGTGAAAGAAAYYLLQQKKEQTPTTGSIVIDIPN